MSSNPLATTVVQRNHFWRRLGFMVRTSRTTTANLGTTIASRPGAKDARLYILAVAKLEGERAAVCLP